MAVRRQIPGVDFPVPYRPDGSVEWPDADPTSPFYIEGPALISFSGGRTSGMMLFLSLWAHGGVLPADVYVCFSNTGKEREETLRFVHECALRWRVTIRWLEWWVDPATPPGTRLPPGQRYREVGYNSASRNGEPFEALIERRGFLPNVVTRFCTSALKINTMECFMRDHGVERWANAVGLRADERPRVLKQLIRNDAGRRSQAIMPLAQAGVTKADVLQFWFGDYYAGGPANWDLLLNIAPSLLPHGFDLGLRDYEGNCDMCFLKGEAILRRLTAENPGMPGWWKDMEAKRRGKTRIVEMGNFSKRFSYAELERRVADSPVLDLGLDDVAFDVECGLGCGGDGDDPGLERVCGRPEQSGEDVVAYLMAVVARNRTRAAAVLQADFAFDGVEEEAE